jgi:uncharacterized protein YjdB
MRRIAVLAAALFLSCGGGATAPGVSTLEVQAPGTPLLSALGDTIQLSASARDSQGAALPGTKPAWSSGDGSIAVVDGSGLVTAIGNGTTAITAAVGGVEGSITVTVAQAVHTVTVQPPSQSVGPGVSFTFAANALDARGHPVVGAPAPVWTVDDRTVATVDPSGTVSVSAILTKEAATAVHAAIGTAFGSAAINVDPAAAPVASISMGQASAALSSVGDTVQLSATALNRGGNAIPGVTLSWSSDHPDFATVDAATGLVTAVGNGTANITAHASGKAGSVAVVVQQVVAEVVVSPNAGASLESLTETLQLVASANDARHHPVAFAGISWTSSNPTVATVDASGLVTAVGDGSATITATSGTATSGIFHDGISVAVQQIVRSVRILPSSIAVAPGSSTHFFATPLDALGQVVVLAPAATWAASDPSVAVDASGNARAPDVAQAASATITATVAQISGSATLKVDPTLLPVAGVAISGGGASLSSIGATTQLSARAVDAQNRPLPGHVIVWTVQDGTSSVVTVDQTGLVTAVANGQKTIVASAEGFSASAPVAVAQALVSVRVAAASPNAPTTLTSLGCSDATATLALTATGFDALNHAVPGLTFGWSSDSDDADVNSSGVVTALANGAANLFAVSQGIESTPGFPVTVAQAVSTIQVSAGNHPTTLTSLGQKLQLSAAAQDACQQPMSAIFTWQPSAGATATVDATGLVTAISNGPTNVQAHSGGRIGVLQIQVAQAPATVAVSGVATLKSIGETQQLSAAAQDALGSPIPGQSFTWSSDSPNVAVDARGAITAALNGTANIVATAGGASSKPFLVTVSQVATKIVITPTNPLLTSLDDTVQLVGTAVDAKAVALPAEGQPAVTFGLLKGTSNAASVSPAGLVTAHNNGGTTVTAAANGLPTVTGSTLVSVQQVIASTIVTPATATVAAFGTAPFKFNADDANGNSVHGTITTWTTSDSNVATVDANGIATGVAPGTAVITATVTATGTPPGIGRATLTVTAP